MQNGHEELHVVAIGGGSGLATLLSGLRQLAQSEPENRLRVTAIVTVADDGGSTGRLRRDLGIPAVGDLRQCVAALAGGDSLWPEIFQHRFCSGDGLDGHALGNLVLAALIDRHGGLQAAIDRLTGPLALRGRVLAVTEEPVSLVAERTGGRVIRGESRILDAPGRIEHVWLTPGAPRPTRGVLEAIAAADAVVLGPGSLFTSIIPNLLVPGVADAIGRAPGLCVYVANLVTERGETDGLGIAEHLDALTRHLGPGTIDVCLADDSPRCSGLGTATAAEGCRLVAFDPAAVIAAGALPMAAPIRADGPRPDRHHPLRLARQVLGIVRAHHAGRPVTARRSPLSRLARTAAAALLSTGAT